MVILILKLEFSVWGEWTPENCMDGCGYSIQSRVRDCNFDPCERKESRTCETLKSTKSSLKSAKVFFLLKICSKLSEWSDWSSFSECNNATGSTTRSRKCDGKVFFENAACIVKQCQELNSTSESTTKNSNFP